MPRPAHGVISGLKQFGVVLKSRCKPCVIQSLHPKEETDPPMMIALTLAAALAGQSAPPPPAETRREIRFSLPGNPGSGPRGFFMTSPDAGRPDLDKNNDGFVTREEFTASQNAAFDMLDANRDGRISTEEFASGRAAARVILGGAGGPGRLDVIGGGRVMMSRDGGPGAPDAD